MTKIVGILNITPDSFSGDGLYRQNVRGRIAMMIEEGADIIDIGAESTRPDAVIITAEEEWQRFVPVISNIVTYAGNVHFSIDTRHAQVAEQFIHAFPEHYHKTLYINDVSGGKDKKLIDIALKYETHLILMHSLTVPANKNVLLPKEANVTEIISEWGRGMIQEYGSSVILDPGIGFGKNSQQSLKLLKEVAQFKALGARVMVGHSRKSFLSSFSNKKSSERDGETVLISNYLAEQGVDYLRVHDVKNHTVMLKIRKALYPVLT